VRGIAQKRKDRLGLPLVILTAANQHDFTIMKSSPAYTGMCRVACSLGVTVPRLPGQRTCLGVHEIDCLCLTVTRRDLAAGWQVFYSFRHTQKPVVNRLCYKLGTAASLAVYVDINGKRPDNRHSALSRHATKCGAGRISGTDLNGDNLRIYRVYPRLL